MNRKRTKFRKKRKKEHYLPSQNRFMRTAWNTQWQISAPLSLKRQYSMRNVELEHIFFWISCNKTADVPLCGWNFKETASKKKRGHFDSHLNHFNFKGPHTMKAIGGQWNRTASMNIPSNTCACLLGASITVLHLHWCKEAMLVLNNAESALISQKTFLLWPIKPIITDISPL